MKNIFKIRNSKGEYKRKGWQGWDGLGDSFESEKNAKASLRLVSDEDEDYEIVEFELVEVNSERVKV